MTKEKVFIIGIDGASIDLIMDWAEQGKLPNIKKIIAGGVHGRLKTVPNMNSAPAWTSIYTGQNPGNHGIHFFYEKKMNSYDIRYLNGSDCDEPPVWSVLSNAGKSVAVINVPMTYPAIPVNGVMISGFDAPGLRHNAVFPESLMEELKKNIPDYFIELGLATYARHGNYEKLIEKALHSIEIRTKAAIHFMDSRESDFFMVVYRETDIIQHAFWKYDEKWFHDLKPVQAGKYKGTIQRIYQAIDKEIGKLLEKIDDQTTVIIVSDHGGVSFDNCGDLIGDFLSEMGYMKYLKQRKAGFMGHFIKKTVKNAADFADKYIPRKIKEHLARLLPELRNKASQYQIFGNIDWQQTKVFCTTRPELWINLKGREALGIVEKGKAYDDFILDVKDKLLSWIDPQTGEYVIQDVKTKEDVYYGKNLKKAPDLTLFFNRKINPSGIALKQPDGSLRIIKQIDKNSQVDAFISGGHGDNGTIIIKGPQIKSGEELKNAELTDVTPTILHILLGLDFGLDGNILESAMNIDYITKHPPRWNNR